MKREMERKKKKCFRAFEQKKKNTNYIKQIGGRMIKNPEKTFQMDIRLFTKFIQTLTTLTITQRLDLRLYANIILLVQDSEVLGSVLDVVLSKGRDEVVRVVVAVVETQVNLVLILRSLGGLNQVFRKQLLASVEVVALANVNKDLRRGSGVLLDKLAGIMLLPLSVLFSLTKVASESLDTPGGVDGVADGRKG